MFIPTSHQSIIQCKPYHSSVFIRSIFSICLSVLAIGCTQVKRSIPPTQTPLQLRSLKPSSLQSQNHQQPKPCDTQKKRFFFNKMKKMITSYSQSFQKTIEPLHYMPLSTAIQLTKSYYNIEFSKGLLKRLDLMQNVLSSCPSLQKEFLVYRHQLASHLDEVLLESSK